MLHRGKKVLAGLHWPIEFWECWCGARWLSEPRAHAYRWCPLAPAGPDVVVPAGVLSVEITTPEWAARSVQPHVVAARVGPVSTSLASAATVQRALLIAHAIQIMYEKAPQAFQRAW